MLLNVSIASNCLSSIKLGLPEWLVEMRHQATHASLPSLDMLRTAAETSLAWLKVGYHIKA